MSGGVRRMCTPCFSCISFIASAWPFCHFAHQRENDSFAAERTASCCCGVSPFHTSRLKMISPVEVDSCMPGV